MVIRRLSLHNFGVYAGDNEFLFKKNRKKVTLIGGMNGRGKTTFLEAVLLALYGANSFAVTESNYSYGEYLRAHINTSDGNTESSVTLEFDMKEEDDSNTYIVTRSWNGSKSKIYDKVIVRKNGVEDKFLTQNWTMFIESILPSALANFFFFDGEKIAELAEGETSPQMKNSIKVLLGINVLDTLETDLNRIYKKISNEITDSYDAIHLDELRSKKEEKEALLSQIDTQIKFTEDALKKASKNLHKKRKEFEAKGGNIAEQSKELFIERGNLGGKAEQIRSDFVETAATEIPLVLVKKLICRISEQTSKEQESLAMQTAAKKIEDMYSIYERSIADKSAISEFIKFIKAETDKNKIEMIYNLSENGYLQAKILDSAKLDNAVENYKKSLHLLKNIEIRLDEIDNYLAVDIDEKAIAKIYRRICELEKAKAELEIQLEAKKKDRIAVNGDCIRATTEFNRCVEQSLRVIEHEDDRERLIKYTLMVQQTVQRYRTELQKAKVDKLAKTMTECCLTLFGKKNFIRQVCMDEDTLEYTFFDKYGNEIAKNSLSAGEKQLMVISMLWALAICSRKKLPVIIDTPLARLDSKHREALIEKYFPKASDQTIVLSTDVEIDSVYYNKLEKHIANEFTLVYDDETKCSSIETGYFKEVIG